MTRNAYQYRYAASVSSVKGKKVAAVARGAGPISKLQRVKAGKSG